MSDNLEELMYLDLVRYILDSGTQSDDRTGVGTKSIFSANLSFDLSEGKFPLLTTKTINFKHIVTELLWFLKGDTNIKFLHDHGCKIWDEWADSKGDLGPVYGKQWRNWQGPDRWSYSPCTWHGTNDVDQITNLVIGLKNNPNSRRHLVIAYNPAELPKVAPPACHTLFQVYVRDGKISLQLYQRSADLMVGVPYNIASYSLLLLMLAQVTGLKPDKYHHIFGDVHIYNNHMEGVKEQLSRIPTEFPTVTLNKEVSDIFKFEHRDIVLSNYNPQKFIKFPIAV